MSSKLFRNAFALATRPKRPIRSVFLQLKGTSKNPPFSGVVDLESD